MNAALKRLRIRRAEDRRKVQDISRRRLRFGRRFAGWKRQRGSNWIVVRRGRPCLSYDRPSQPDAGKQNSNNSQKSVKASAAAASAFFVCPDHFAGSPPCRLDHGKAGICLPSKCSKTHPPIRPHEISYAPLLCKTLESAADKFANDSGRKSNSIRWRPGGTSTPRNNMLAFRIGCGSPSTRASQPG